MTTDRLHILKELRDRIARATWADRGLDRDIWLLLKGEKDHNVADPSFSARGSVLLLEEDDRLHWFDVPMLTGSRDAASTLVPDGAWKEVSGPRKYLNIPTYSPNYWRCHMMVWDSPTSDRNFDGWGATEPLSIVDARLRYEIATADSTEKAEG